MTYARPTSGGKLTLDGRVIAPYEARCRSALRLLPGAHWDPEARCWCVSLAPQDRRRLLEGAVQLGLEVARPLCHFTPSPAGRRAEGAGLFPFQVEGVEWLAGRRRALLGDEMGLGKTAQALLALPDNVPALVICPASVKYNWREEIKRWRPGFAVEVLEGKESFRLPCPNEIVVANYELLPQGLLYLLPGDETRDLARTWLIVDEAHMVKNRKSQRSKRVRMLMQHVHTAWGLTGTPLLNTPQDLFGVLQCFGLETEAYGSWDQFVPLFRGKRKRWGGFTWGTPSPEAPDRLRRVMLRRRRQDVLPQLPPKLYQQHVVPLRESLRGDLDVLWKEFGELLQTAQELPPLERFSSVREKLARSRIGAMRELVATFEEEDEPLVVFSAHRGPIDALASREGWGVITGDTTPSQRQAVVADFQAGKLNGVGLTIRAGSTGLTLTRASTMLFVDLDWTPATNQQAEDRICRIGQEADAVRIIRMVSDHALDLHLLKVLDRKANLIGKAIETTGPR